MSVRSLGFVSELEVAKKTRELIFEREKTPGGGFKYIGRTKNIAVKDFLAALPGELDETLPDIIANISLTKLEVIYTSITSERIYAFEIDLDGIKLTLGIKLTKDPQTQVTKKTLLLTINNLQFQLYFSKNVTSNLFVATYNDPDKTSIKIKELIEPISADVASYIPESLEISLKNALFAYNKEGETSKFILGLDLGGNITLSDLPLVGKKFPQDQTAGVEGLRILVASEQFAQTKPINDLLPQNIIALPQKIPNQGLSLSAVMRFGDKIETLELAIAGKQPTPTPTAAAAPVAQTTAPTTTPATPTALAQTTPTTSDKTKWFNLQKTFGPVQFKRVGVQYQNSAVWFLLDAALSAAGLTLSLDGLSVGSSIKEFEPRFRLQGLGIDYKSKGAIAIGGAFLKAGNEYFGAAVISTKTLTLSAIGSYTEIDGGHPSLFIYAILDKPIGGPAFFFVTGLALGFAYNRSLILPTLDQVFEYPLVKAAVGDASAGAGGLIEIQRQLQPYIPPKVGQVALAVGIKFTSFKIINSFALLIAIFGDRFELSLIGISTLIAPPAEVGQVITPLAQVRIALLARFIPSEGILQVEGKLLPDSYLFARNCQLTGGFAFYCWFAGQYAGDFVLTVGGYHPRFPVPAHYPKVDPLGLNWRISSKLSIKGSVYFALTSSAFMAGGRLEAVWKSGNLKAWFIAQAHFLISWRPYFYDASIRVQIGVSYTFKIFGFRKTISVDVSAGLHIWGPEFSGTASVDLSIVSFTVRFGSRSATTPPPISWSEFKASFLPAQEEICSIAVKTGLLRTVGEGESELWIVNPKEFVLMAGSVIPAKTSEATNVGSIGTTEEKFGVAPMNTSSDEFSESKYTISITEAETGVEQQFAYIPIYKNVPVAMWGESSQTNLKGKKFINQALSGFEIKPKNPPKPGETQNIDRRNLSYDSESLRDFYDWQELAQFSTSAEADEDVRERAISSSINTKDAERRELLSELGFSSTEINEIDLQEFNPENIEQAFMIAPQLVEV